MRNLAKSLGFEVMSLYNHVANKADMLEAMVDEVAGQIEQPDNALGWKLALRNNAFSAQEILLAHPWAGGLWNTSGGPNRLAYLNKCMNHVEVLKSQYYTIALYSVKYCHMVCH